AGGARVLLAEHARARSGEDQEVIHPIAVEIGDLKAGDVSLAVLLDHEHVEHPDDPTIHEIHKQRDRLSRAGRVRRIADHYNVDRTEVQLLVAHRCFSEWPALRLGAT